MSKKLTLTLVSVLLMSVTAHAQDAKAVLENAARAMGATNLKSIQYSGSGHNFAVGQSPNPNAPWPIFNVKSYTRVINYETASSREELVRAQALDPPRGGGAQPIPANQTQVLVVSGTHAWNVAGNNVTPALAAAEERALQLWLTPHGFLKAAMTNNATARPGTAGGKRVTTVSFTALGKFKVNGTINDQGLVERVETWIDNPVLGDMPIVVSYSDYGDFNGVKFPCKITQTQGGHPALDLVITQVQPNASVNIQVPDNVRQATAPVVRVESQKLADGVWYLTGGSHHSAVVEFKDHVVVVEGPQNEARSLAVIAEVKKLVPNKPIKYLVNTHHHFDHSGGIRTFAAEGATIITHEINRPFYVRAFRAGRTVNPDKLAQSKKPAKFLTVGEKHTLTDGTRVVELHQIQGNRHNDGFLMAYLPKEKILIEADAFTPPAPNAPPPSPPNPYTTNLHDNIERLKLSVDQIAPLHGRLVAMADLLRAIGKSQ
jgi:glyoxylase-like metal-dependent hydrolase (beta-lactamase superfamily II)